MIYKLSLLFVSLLPLGIFAMDKQPLAPWVQKVNKIEVASTLKKTMRSYSIDDDTTVLELKKQIQDDQGIAFDQQSLLVLIRHWWLFEKNGPYLADSDNIKQVMARYNTRRLLLLSLRKPVGDQK